MIVWATICVLVCLFSHAPSLSTRCKNVVSKTARTHGQRWQQCKIFKRNPLLSVTICKYAILRTSFIYQPCLDQKAMQELCNVTACFTSLWSGYWHSGSSFGKLKEDESMSKNVVLVCPVSHASNQTLIAKTKKCDQITIYKISNEV